MPSDDPSPKQPATGAASNGNGHTNGNGHAQGAGPGLVVGALGVVFGDIGTSPLYAMKEVFSEAYAVTATHDHVLGAVSLVFWALMLVVSVKYVMFIMRADNNGEGGIMALIALVLRGTDPGTDASKRRLLMMLGIFGAALFYGDGAITPAISVLSAVEGLNVIAPRLSEWVVPITLAVLILLFLFQRKGTSAVGKLFGPITLGWFLALGIGGIASIAQTPEVLAALHPGYGVRFLIEQKFSALFVLGAVVLAVTGAEALYADMGHFGRTPIRVAWFGLVLPALVLNYYGQAAVMLRDPTAIRNPFYLMFPEWAQVPMLLLATAATVIASQAVITGAFSMTRQAIQLGYCPRLAIAHTSEDAIGQVYIPWVNWMLLVAVVALVLGFQSSTALASAYGIAVTGTMAIDTVLAAVVFRRVWGWGYVRTYAFLGVFLTIDLAFFGANTLKILEGGWFPITLGVVGFTVLTTWKRGRELLMSRLRESSIELRPFIEGIERHPPQRVPGTGAFMTADRDGVPHALLHNLLHNKVLHERVLLITVMIDDVPCVEPDTNMQIESLGGGFFRVLIRFGFRDVPDVPTALARLPVLGQRFEMMETSFFLSRETVVPTVRVGMALWRERLFAAMVRNAGSASAYFRLPPNRVIELGSQVEI
ncbi:MAG: potassium transporter Kup [Proteobacteria bacterium]|nr:potassium transporter Kup [Burkholderiales bacterium]